MFGMSAERNEVERPARIDTGGTAARRSLSTRKKTLLPAIVIYCIRSFRRSAHSAPVRILCKPRSELKSRGTERCVPALGNSRNRSLRRRAAGVNSRNRSLRSLCTRKKALQPAPACRRCWAAAQTCPGLLAPGLACRLGRRFSACG